MVLACANAGEDVSGTSTDPRRTSRINADAVLTTHLAGLAPSEAAPYTVAFVILRIIHAVTYIKDIDKVRSGSFILSLICLITLFVKAA